MTEREMLVGLARIAMDAAVRLEGERGAQGGREEWVLKRFDRIYAYLRSTLADDPPEA